MDDKELLELAAKAAGFDVVREVDSFTGLLLYGVQDVWNPLEDDGDALRLAVTLRISVDYSHHGTVWVLFRGTSLRYDYQVPETEVSVSNATRRAIVLAAAEIGRNM